VNVSSPECWKYHNTVEVSNKFFEYVAKFVNFGTKITVKLAFMKKLRAD
jgi:hypothetical protein